MPTSNLAPYLQFLSQQTWSEAKKHAKQVALGRRVAYPDDLPPALSSLIRSCIDQNPNLRPEAEHVIEALQNLNHDPDFLRVANFSPGAYERYIRASCNCLIAHQREDLGHSSGRNRLRMKWCGGGHVDDTWCNDVTAWSAGLWKLVGWRSGYADVSPCVVPA